jgi:hypothetical protein
VRELRGLFSVALVLCLTVFLAKFANPARHRRFLWVSKEISLEKFVATLGSHKTVSFRSLAIFSMGSMR